MTGMRAGAVIGFLLCLLAVALFLLLLYTPNCSEAGCGIGRGIVFSAGAIFLLGGLLLLRTSITNQSGTDATTN